MEWAKDRKNLPFIIGGAVLLIIAVVVGILFATGVFGGSAPPATTTATNTTTGTGAPPGAPGYPGASPYPGGGGMPGYPGGGYPGMGGYPGGPGDLTASAGQSAGPSTAPLKHTGPVILTAKDPFKVALNDQVGTIKVPKVPIRTYVPDLTISKYKDPSVINIPKPPVLPQVASAAIGGARVSGILFSNGVSAILDMGGQSQAVKPGDAIDGGRVVSIQADGLTVRTDDGRTLNIPLAPGSPGGGFGGPGGPGGGYGGPGGGFPGGGPGGGYPGGGFGGPGRGFPGGGGFPGGPGGGLK